MKGNQFTLGLRTNMNIKIVNKSENPLPCYAREGDAGMDICAAEDVRLKAFNWAVIPTGLYLEIPEGYEVQIRSRSGLSAKHGICVLNSPGTIDSGYRGEIKVILINLSNKTQVIEFGDKIAQAVICPVIQGRDVKLNRVKEIKEKDRNSNGFGSTGN